MEKHVVLQVIPALPVGHYLLWFWPADADGGASVCREPIVAWAHMRVGDHDELHPVTVDQFGWPGDDGAHAVLHPDGSVTAPGDRTWDSEAAWKVEREAWVQRAASHG
jgi:hypothetical protein